MVAYVFLQRFVPAIMAGTKRQTLRAPRKRHARVGEAVDMMTSDGGKFAWSLCSAVEKATLFLRRDRVIITGVNGVRPILSRADLDEFAVEEGFRDWRELNSYWSEIDPGAPSVDCVIIRWEDLL